MHTNSFEPYTDRLWWRLKMRYAPNLRRRTTYSKKLVSQEFDDTIVPQHRLIDPCPSASLYHPPNKQCRLWSPLCFRYLWESGDLIRFCRRKSMDRKYSSDLFIGYGRCWVIFKVCYCLTDFERHLLIDGISFWVLFSSMIVKGPYGSTCTESSLSLTPFASVAKVSWFFGSVTSLVVFPVELMHRTSLGKVLLLQIHCSNLEERWNIFDKNVRLDRA